MNETAATDWIEAPLSRSEEHDPNPHLMLDKHLLHAGHALDVLVQGHWISGHIELGRFSGQDASHAVRRWYLETNEENAPTILLRPGVMARVHKDWVK